MELAALATTPGTGLRQATGPATGSPAGPATDPLRQTAEDFEAVFLATVISRMFESLPTDGPFGGGHAEETFRTFLADEYAREIARGGGIGIADTIHAELVRLQEASE